MKKKTCLGFVLAFLFLGISLNQSQAASRNLIPCNAGFEVGTGGWRFFLRESGFTPQYKFIPPQILTNGAPEGRYYVHLQPDGIMNWAFEPFAAKLAPGKTYTLSAWVRGTGQMRMTLVRECNDGAGCLKNVVENSEKVISLTKTWQRCTVTFKLAEESDRWFYVAFSGNRPLDLDAVQLEEGERASAYQPVAAVEVGGEANKRFHLFDVGDDGRARVMTVIHGGNPREVKIQWEVQDHRLQPVAKGERNIVLVPEQPAVFEIPINTRLKGGFRMALTAKDPVTGAENFFPIVYAVIPKPVECNDPSRSSFGVQDSLTVGFWKYRVYYGYTSIDECLDLMQRLGVHASREQYGYHTPKTFESDPDWKDWWIDGLLQRKIQPYICLYMSVLPPWARAKGEKWGETDEPFAPWTGQRVPTEEGIRFQVRKTVEHFKGRVRVYEIGWETESSQTPENFAKVAKWMADEARKTDPAAKVVGVCPSVDPRWAGSQRDESWLAHTLPLVKGIFDGFTAHYLGSTVNEAPENAIDEPLPNGSCAMDVIWGMNQLLEKNGLPPRTWGDTENLYNGSTMYVPYFGSMCTPAPHIIRLQAENMVRRMIVGLGLGIERLFYFRFDCITIGDAGFFEWNMMPRPMAAAWAQMGQRIENAEFVAQLSAPPDVRAYLFKRDDGPCVVYWHKDCQDGAKLNFVLPGSGWTAEDIMGNPINMRRPWYQRFFCNKTSLPLSSSAVYLFGPGLTEKFLRKSFIKAIVAGVKPRIKMRRIFNNAPAELLASANVFGAVHDIIYQAKISEPMDPCPAVLGMVFILNDGQVAALACARTGQEMKMSLPLAQEQVEIRNVYGQTLSTSFRDGMIQDIPLGVHPVILLGKGIEMAAMKKAVAESQVIGPPMFQVGRISMANVLSNAPPAFVVPIRNDGTKPLSGKVQLKGAPIEWGLPETAAFENIGRGEERLIYFTPKQLPKLVEGVKLEGSIQLATGDKALVEPRVINILRCPWTSGQPTLDGSIASNEWEQANWIEVGSKERLTLGADQWKGVEDGSMRVGLMRGERALLVYAQVKDDIVKQKEVPKQLCWGDAIEIWMDAEPDKDLFVKEVHPNHAGVVTFGARGDVEREKRIVTTTALYQISDLYSCQAEFKKTDTGYDLEIQIPLYRTGKGKVIGFDIGFDDADQYQRKYQMIWSGYGRNSQDPSRYGFLIFE